MKEVLYVYLSKESKEKLKRLAEDDDRSMSSFLEQLIKKLEE